MDIIFKETVKSSLVLGLMFAFWFYQRKDYKGFIKQAQDDNAAREENYQKNL